MLACDERGSVDDRRRRRVLVVILMLVLILVLVLVLVLGAVLEGGPSRWAPTGVAANALVGRACLRRKTWIRDKMLFGR